MVRIDSIRSAGDAEAFRRLNEQWIRAYFTLEPKDRATLADPVAHFVAPGGDVLIARDDTGAPIGCVALEPLRDGAFELSKMAVDEAARGHGTGRRLVAAALARARELGARSVFLGSNRRLRAAVALYESAGFEHVDRSAIGPMPYTRADVFMSRPVDAGDSV